MFSSLGVRPDCQGGQPNCFTEIALDFAFTPPLGQVMKYPIKTVSCRNLIVRETEPVLGRSARGGWAKCSFFNNTTRKQIMVKSEIKVVSYDEQSDTFDCEIYNHSMIKDNYETMGIDAAVLPLMVGEWGEPSEFVGRTFNLLGTGQLRKHGVSEISINACHDMYFGEFGIEGWGWVDPRCDLDFLNTLLEHPEFLFFLVENKDEILKQAWDAAKQGIGAEIELM